MLQVANTGISNGEVLTAVEVHSTEGVETFGESLSLREQECIVAAINRHIEDECGRQVRNSVFLRGTVSQCLSCTSAHLQARPQAQQKCGAIVHAMHAVVRSAPFR